MTGDACTGLAEPGSGEAVASVVFVSTMEDGFGICDVDSKAQTILDWQED